MGSTYEYVYEYEVPSNARTQRTTGAAGSSYQQRSTAHQPVYHQTASTFGRTNNMDPLVNLQHDRIWHKLYDPLDSDKSSNETEAQKMARRQDRKVIKLEAAYGSDRQTFIVKRNYDLRAADVLDDAAKVFKIPVESLVLYWKGRNVCETPNELLETLGIENNHQMRVCRDDDPTQQNRRRELRGQPGSDQVYSSSNNDMYRSAPQQQQQQQAAPYSSSQDQQAYGATQRTNYYQQLTNPNAGAAPPAAVAPSFLLNLQIGFGDRLEGMIIGRPHPITIYDLQVELQQRFNIPVLEQNVSYNGMPLTQFPPDAALESLGILNNSFISLWYKSAQQPAPQPSGQMNDYYSGRQAQPPGSMYGEGSQTSRGNEGPYDQSSRYTNDSTQNNGNQEVLKIEVFHGSDRHVLILRSTNNLRIVDLMEELQRITTVPIPTQKLYFRGQELQHAKERTLREAGIDNNAQVRLIGDPTKARYEAMISGNRP